MVDLLRLDVELLRDTVALLLLVAVLLDEVLRLLVVVVVREEFSLRLPLCASAELILPNANTAARHNVNNFVFIASRIKRFYNVLYL